MNPPSNSDTILVAARTVKGLRSENQDAVTSFYSPFGFVYLVADGMGGTQGGSTASNMTTECYRKYLTSLPDALPTPEALQRATAATNAEIRLRSQSGDPAVAGMGSTVVMAIFANTESGLLGTIAHIGDSRAYLLRRAALSRLTRDHSAVQRLLDNGQITEEEARNHPDASVITRALGPQDEVQIEVSEHTFEPGDTLLLCSDGLSGYVEDHAIAAELAQPRELVATAEALIALAMASGSSDNISVQVLKVAPPPMTEHTQPSFQRHSAKRPPSPSASSAQKRTSSYWPLLTHTVALLTGLVLGHLLPTPFKPLLFHQTKKPDKPGLSTNPNPSRKGMAPAGEIQPAQGTSTTRDDKVGPDVSGGPREPARPNSKHRGPQGARLRPDQPPSITPVVEPNTSPVPQQSAPVSRPPALDAHPKLPVLANPQILTDRIAETKSTASGETQ